ncbi:inositol monophosphatase [Leucobacter sp. cx-328]|uniref:inositol monophosphatase family protein n=1 Tax=unclassified Leucobacter TaxID=2621730 RepID=UPI00165D64DD|nr:MULTISPECIES: inositol monophosphatase family protein [unclassified Leucobacter]MBC9944220.1 inositol monophosphatase [Leucobacter sp. cx-328]
MAYLTPTALQAALPELESLAATLAREAGIEAMRMRAEGVSVAATKSSDIDIVTYADRATEARITAALRAARPDDGILGEEGASAEGASGITWVIDPIDGTVNYLYDQPAYVVSIAATVADPLAFADGRRAVAGAVYAPRFDELFSAHTGGGSRLNGSVLNVSDVATPAHALVATGFGYTVERKHEQLVLLTRLLPRIRDIRRLGAAAYDLCSLAAGRVDAFYEKGLQPWDYAAGALIASEAGAMILGADEQTAPGEPLLFAGNETLVTKIRDIVRGL